MLKSIKKIKKFGIFGDYTVDAKFNEFCQFNLFYGWNGSGKTTLSRLFGMLDKKHVDPAFDDCEFEIILNDGAVVKNNNLSSYNTKVFVFNQVFIEENIDWKTQGAKTIVVISEDKINERKRYFELKDVLIPGKETLYKAAQDIYTYSVKERDDFLSERAKGIKQSFQFIDTNDVRYMNYDRTKIRAYIDSHKIELADPTSVLSNEQLEQLKMKIQPIHKPVVQFEFSQLDHNLFAKAEDTIEKMLTEQVVNETIERLKNNEDINNWVQEGLLIHAKHLSEGCEYCGQVIPADRIRNLQNHFSDVYINLLGKLEKTRNWIEGIEVCSVFPDAANIYDEFKKEYNSAVAACKSTEELMINLLNNWKRRIEEKMGNVFASNLAIPKGIDAVLATLRSARASVNSVLVKHNNKSKSFEIQLKTDKERIELHFVAQAVKEKDYYTLLERIGKEQAKVEAIKKDVDRFVAERIKLEGGSPTLRRELIISTQNCTNFSAEMIFLCNTILQRKLINS